MSRVALLLLTFFASALAARIGLATASDVNSAPDPRIEVDRDLSPVGETSLSEPPSFVQGADLHTDLGESTPPAAEATSSWPRRIEDRLASLSSMPRVRSTAATSPTDDKASDEERALARRVRTLIARHAGNARVAVHVRDLDRNRVLFERQGSRPLNPASNQKILSSAAALELLGAEYRFETRAYLHEDTLYLVGEGDPSLQSSDLYTLAEAVTQAVEPQTIQRIAIDDYAFDAQQIGPGYDPEGEGESYQAPSGALSLNFNTVSAHLRPASHGEALTVELSPRCDAIEIINDSRTGRGSKLSVRSEAVGERTRLRVSGSLAGGHRPVTIRRRVADPGLFTGSVFSRILREMDKASGEDAGGVPVVRKAVPQDAILLATHRSEPLARVLAAALKYSNNFTTEQVLRTLAWRADGSPGTWSKGVALMRRFLGGISEEAEGFTFVNASGLNRQGRATARGLVDILALTQRDERASASMLPALARAGGEGTLRYRVPYAGSRLRAKTGTMAGVSSLSGVVTASDGERHLGFSILVNGGSTKKARALQNRIVSAILTAT